MIFSFDPDVVDEDDDLVTCRLKAPFISVSNADETQRRKTIIFFSVRSTTKIDWQRNFFSLFSLSLELRERERSVQKLARHTQREKHFFIISTSNGNKKMKPVLTVFFVCVLIFLALGHCAASIGERHKRYYDSWDSPKGETEAFKGWKKGDLCENKPLWFLKHQARLGKLSPFHDCLVEHGLERK